MCCHTSQEFAIRLTVSNDGLLYNLLGGIVSVELRIRYLVVYAISQGALHSEDHRLTCMRTMSSPPAAVALGIKARLWSMFEYFIMLLTYLQILSHAFLRKLSASLVTFSTRWRTLRRI